MSDPHDRDPFQYAQEAQEAQNAAAQQVAGEYAAANVLGHAVGYGAINAPYFDRHQTRMQCLQMALYVPDGAAPPPLTEVIERATAYWRFVAD